jgi:hypothetical protein
MPHDCNANQWFQCVCGFVVFVRIHDVPPLQSVAMKTVRMMGSEKTRNLN